jgi:hypothetical protein
MRHLLTPVAALLMLNYHSTFGQEQRGLRLTASVIGQQSCRASESRDVLHLTVRLRYTNVGAKKLILYKGNRLFYQVYISRSREEAASKKYELHTTHARYFDEQQEKINAAQPSGVFTLLPPGASYETKQVIAVTVARGESGKTNASIAAGEHVLYLVASTWYESRKLAEELRERWQRSGFLWAEPVGSNLVGFVVDDSRPAIACQ